MMTQRKFIGLALLPALAALLLSSCATQRGHSGAKDALIVGESLVLVGQKPGMLAFLPSPRQPIALRNTYWLGSSNTVEFVEGRDFTVDYMTGTLQRSPGSRIPDFSTNMLHGVRDFDHSRFPGFGNNQFFVFADYTPLHRALVVPPHWPRQPSQAHLLDRTKRKLIAGEKVRIIAFGDSITAGGDASAPELIFWRRWAAELKQRYPQAVVESVNGATGGDRTSDGLSRLKEKVLNQNPDLVLIGFGMNDNNAGPHGTPLDQFAANLIQIIDRIRQETGAEVILYSAFPPNPNWLFGSKNMGSYAATTEAVAQQKQCAFADVYRNWMAFSAHKKPEDLLGNNINHPNDFGHWLYLQVLNNIGL